MTENQKERVEEALGGKRYVSADVLANLFELSVRQIYTLSQQNIIKAQKVPGYSSKMYDLAECVNLYVSVLRGKNDSNSKKQKDTEDELKTKKLKADIALKEIQKDYRKLQNDIASGKYISVEQVKLEYSTFFVDFKKAMINIPPRVAGIIAGSVDLTEVRRIEKEIMSEITDMLNEFIIGPEEEGDSDA